MLTGIRALLLDIEGTTTPISFVKEILFGFVRTNIQQYVETNFEIKQLQDDIRALRQQAVADVCAGASDVTLIPENTDCVTNKESIIAAVVDYVLQQMDKDKKTTALKQLQGHMWKQAYETGQILAQVYEDVAPALKRLTSSGCKVFIYSSGSVEAQKLLFGHSTSGSLLQYLSGYFDTNIGAKVSSESYSKIAEQIELPPTAILFLTDIPAEAMAAAEAGIHTSLVNRHGNAPLSDEHKRTFHVISTFNELFEI